MPKNKGKGGKNRRRGKNENEGLKRELVFKEDGQEYAQVGLKQNTKYKNTIHKQHKNTHTRRIGRSMLR